MHTQTQAIELLTRGHDGALNADFKVLETVARVTAGRVHVRILELELFEESEQPVDALSHALNFDGPGARVLQSSMVGPEDFLLELASSPGGTEKDPTGLVEITVQFGLQTAACAIERA